MAIDFSFPEELEFVTQKVRDFMAQVVRPAEKIIEESDDDRKTLVEQVKVMRRAAKEWGLGHVAMAAVSAEAAKTRFGPFALPTKATCIPCFIGRLLSRKRST